MHKHKASIYQFKDVLRLHDNPALNYAIQHSFSCFPVFFMDTILPENRQKFLFDSLNDLDCNLKKHGMKLWVFKDASVLSKLIDGWGVTLLCRDDQCCDRCDGDCCDDQCCDRCDGDSRDDQCCDNQCACRQHADHHIERFCASAVTLYNLDELYSKNNNNPALTYRGFLGLIGEPIQPVVFPCENKCLVGDVCHITRDDCCDYHKQPVDFDHMQPVDSVKEYLIDLKSFPHSALKFQGGESQALNRLESVMSKPDWIRSFSKPDTSPNSLEPSTTVLSPYLSFGCLSPRLFYQSIKKAYSNEPHTNPPVSLLGQLLWREFFHFNARFIPNFNQITGNPICRKIDWDSNEDYIAAWEEGRTGYPFIDAVMTQLREEGWIHHLARHAVACFLTRGDLYQSWTVGMKIFEELLLDADPSVNAGNWMWLSCSAFFHQYFRVYSPVGFGKKTDKNGDYIRKYVKVLKDFPAKYIYEPWKAPLEVQKKAGCVVGRDYPKPIVDHNEAKARNIQRIKKFFKN